MCICVLGCCGEALHKQARVMSLSCNQVFGWGHIYHHCGLTSSNLRAGRHDSSKNLPHSLCINPLIGLLPAASPVNNCRSGLRGKTLYVCHPVEKTLNLLRRAMGSKCRIWGKRSLSGHCYFFEPFKVKFVWKLCRLPPLRWAVTLDLCLV